MTGDGPPPADGRAVFLRDVLSGLGSSPKVLPSKYLYDSRGSELFERICRQPEYYLTRTELGILRACAQEIADAVGPDVQVVEYGSGAGVKTQVLLSALRSPAAYVPVEISRSALDASVQVLAEAFPGVEMLPLCGDFVAPLTLPVPARQPASVLVFFPGSTIGNFPDAEAVRLLGVMRGEMGDRGAALVGIDLRKDRATLEAAYNDAAGVTAAFTLNLLQRINRELEADFDLPAFAHRARYNDTAGRIETHIVSRAAQRVHVAGRAVDFADGEAMHVETSCKYSLDSFAGIAKEAGLRVDRFWTDRQQRFALVLLRP